MVREIKNNFNICNCKLLLGHFKVNLRLFQVFLEKKSFFLENMQKGPFLTSRRPLKIRAENNFCKNNAESKKKECRKECKMIFYSTYRLQNFRCDNSKQV